MQKIASLVIHAMVRNGQWLKKLNFFIAAHVVDKVLVRFSFPEKKNPIKHVPQYHRPCVHKTFESQDKDQT